MSFLWSQKRSERRDEDEEEVRNLSVVNCKHWQLCCSYVLLGRRVHLWNMCNIICAIRYVPYHRYVCSRQYLVLFAFATNQFLLTSTTTGECDPQEIIKYLSSTDLIPVSSRDSAPYLFRLRMRKCKMYHEPSSDSCPESRDPSPELKLKQSPQSVLWIGLVTKDQSSYLAFPWYQIFQIMQMQKTSGSGRKRLVQ